jgi:hypothetical protein
VLRRLGSSAPGVAGVQAWPLLAVAGAASGGLLVLARWRSRSARTFDLRQAKLRMGYATLPRLLQHVPADQVDAVVITHRHPDHCADLGPLLRARSFPGTGAPPLAVYSLPGAVDAVLAWMHLRRWATSRRHHLASDSRVHIGPLMALAPRAGHPNVCATITPYNAGVGGSNPSPPTS